MNGSALLLTPDGRLRAPWRILLFIVVLFMAVAVTITLEAFLDSAVLAAGYRPPLWQRLAYWLCWATIAAVLVYAVWEAVR